MNESDTFDELKYKIVRDDGDVFYYNSADQLHRENGPAIEWLGGDEDWYINGKLHREGGPAVIYANGVKQWYRHGKPHREDGPAIEWVNGAKEWFINGKELTEEEFNEYRRNQNLSNS